VDSYFVVSLYVGGRLINRFGPYVELKQAAEVADLHAHGWTSLVSYLLTIEEVYCYDGTFEILSTKYEVRI